MAKELQLLKEVYKSYCYFLTIYNQQYFKGIDVAIKR